MSAKHDEVFKTAAFLSYVKELCPHYGYLRVKWNIAKGFRFDIRSEKDEEWVLQQKHSVPTSSQAPQS